MCLDQNLKSIRVFLIKCQLASYQNYFRSSRQRCSIYEKGVFRSFVKFTGKHQCQSLFFVSEPRPATLLKKRLLKRCFPVNFTKFLRTPFLQNTSDGCFCYLNHFKNMTKINCIAQKQPPKGVPRKRCSENMQQIYRRIPIPKCDFNKVALQLCNFIEIALRHGCSPVNLLHVFRTPFLKNISQWLLLIVF